jgi:hypothetical protein
MIHKIAIENFFSIAEKQEISFRVPGNAPHLPCFQKSRVNPEERLPVVVGFFGPNASGKSTILRAVASGALFVRNSFALPPEGHIPFFQPFKRKDWWEKPSKIMVEFDGAYPDEGTNVLFKYELHISHTRNRVGNSVLYEALFFAPKGRFKKVFERKEQSFTFGPEFEIAESDTRVLSIRPNASVVSTLAQLNHKLSLNFISFINTLQTNISGLDKTQFHANQLLPFYANRPEYLDKLNRELRRLDVGLEEMLIEQGSQGLVAKFKHIGLDDFIFMDEESVGTRKFIEVFPKLQYVLETGSVALIDELDTDLHPMLIPELFRWFCDPERNRSGAQLLFTAHNPALLDEMEKEQVFLVEKGSGKPSAVYGARDIQGLRREPSLMKKYLAGELGAVPHIG